MHLSGEGNGTPLQYSCLENPMDGGAMAAVHGVAKSRTRLSDFTFTFHFHALEKEIATHSSVLAWRIPGTGEPGGLPSMRSHRIWHNWSDLAAAVHLSESHEINHISGKPRRHGGPLYVNHMLYEHLSQKLTPAEDQVKPTRAVTGDVSQLLSQPLILARYWLLTFRCSSTSFNTELFWPQK